MPILRQGVQGGAETTAPHGKAFLVINEAALFEDGLSFKLLDFRWFIQKKRISSAKFAENVSD